MNEATQELIESTHIVKLKKGVTGVYCIRNLVNGKRYVGSSSRCILGRWRMHLSHLRGNKHHSIVMQRSWNKHGEDAFEFVLVLECKPVECLGKEQYFIDLWKSHDKQVGYNISPTSSSSMGIKRRPESKEKMRLAKIGRKQTPEHIQKVKDAKIGFKQKQETKDKIRAARLIAPKRSEETRRKIGLGSKGRIHSEESRRRISEGTKRGLSKPEVREKISLRRREQFSDPMAIKASLLTNFVSPPT